MDIIHNYSVLTERTVVLGPIWRQLYIEQQKEITIDFCKCIYASLDKMITVVKAILLVSLLHAATADIKSIDLSNSMTTTWDKIITNRLSNLPIDQRKPLHDIFIGENEHSLAILKCSNPLYDYPTGCTATTHIHTLDGQIHAKTCNLSPPLRDESAWIIPDRITFLKSDRLLVTWKMENRADGWHLKSHVINMDTCRSGDFIPVNSREQMIAPFKNHFDLVFRDDRGCSTNHFCKISSHYDGHPINKLPKPITFPYATYKEPYIINKVYTMISDSEEGMVLSGRKYKVPPSSIVWDIYSPTFGWRSLGGYASLENVYSNSSGYATFCWLTNHREELSCTWLDGTREKDNILNMKLSHPLVNLPWIHNTPNGYLLLMKDGYKDGLKLFVDKTHPEGKCGRIMDIAIPRSPQRVDLSITKNNDYCFSFIFVEDRSYSGLLTHQFVTKCTKMPLDIVPEDITVNCGSNYGI